MDSTLFVAIAALLLLLPFLVAYRFKRPNRLPANFDPASLRLGPVRHEKLSDDQMERIKKLQETFREVDPMPLEKWIDDFKRDADPDREIRVYEGMAEAYTAYCSNRNLTPEAKKDAFCVVLMRSGVPDDEVLSQVKLQVLSLEDVKEILKLYKRPSAPITVTTTPSGR
ncbi:hypothetical protein [Polyangium jinanense]|uniref:Uncharacterized protein n=1 Tax=Polyangium jinanense TaxID=2829994 RepID=A0A9X3XI28_9BACT|nr:hypothetical protein [Polyangium jinanense]MDC3960305.1 hypothetical protein [Polyangium jinanense]MDC3989488.1 hypothetical protein [Polyangium jinanense]